MMKSIHFFGLLTGLFFLTACQKDTQKMPSQPEEQNLSLDILVSNTFNGEEISFSGDQHRSKTYTSAAGQAHSFSEIKYLISSLRLIAQDGKEFAYFMDDLDQGAWLVDQQDTASKRLHLAGIPAGNYVGVKFGLGLPRALNVLDEERFPSFYQKASANDTQMMWEWGTGYRFAKIEGYYDKDDKPMRIHTGSTVQGEDGTEQGVDAYREIVLEFPQVFRLEEDQQEFILQADLNQLLSGQETIELSSQEGDDLNATPNQHSSMQMLRFVNNMAGDGESSSAGMFSLHFRD